MMLLVICQYTNAQNVTNNLYNMKNKIKHFFKYLEINLNLTSIRLIPIYYTSPGSKTTSYSFRWLIVYIFFELVKPGFEFNENLICKSNGTQ